MILGVAPVFAAKKAPKEQKEQKAPKQQKPSKKSKKVQIVKPRMVETVREWEIQAQEIPLNQRTFERPKEEIKANLNKIVDPTPYLVKYNSPVGGYETDLSRIKELKTIPSLGVASPIFDKLAVVYYYYAPVHNNISSELFIVPLDGSKSRINRILDAKVIDMNKGYNLESGTDEFRGNLLSSLTIVDWAPYGRAILLKEKLGTSDSGIFRTNLHAVLVDKGDRTIKSFPQLQETIIKYWRKNGGLILNRYRWDIKVLGFSTRNPQDAIVMAYAYEKGGAEVFLGTWAVNVYTGAVDLVSLRNSEPEVSVNGVILKFKRP